MSPIRNLPRWVIDAPPTSFHNTLNKIVSKPTDNTERLDQSGFDKTAHRRYQQPGTDTVLHVRQIRYHSRY